MAYNPEFKNPARSALSEFAQYGKFSEKLKYLAHLAEKENWKYDDLSYVGRTDEETKAMSSVGVLYQYIIHTFSKAIEDGKVLETETNAIMNTGLFTENGEQIFMLFCKNANPESQKPWYLLSFFPESSHDIPEDMRANLPGYVDYFESCPEDLYFNTEWKIDLNTTHVIEDGFDRLPKTMQSLPKTVLVSVIEALLQTMIKKVKRNQRLVIPEYVYGKIMYLAPLHYGDEIIPVGIEKHENTYRVNTVLTIGMAYCNARLLMKPESNWLVNPK
ncbi:MAG: DUF3825 domain-containing protein [Candidatus Izemoplasmatales bacterium]|nr:DUF3825 domain-containing protein [Candidatus Izemoplasmatales bacterium]